MSTELAHAAVGPRAWGDVIRPVWTHPRNEATSDVEITQDFETFVSATADQLMRAAVLLCGGDRQSAEDLVQSTYATAYVKWHLITAADHPAAYTRTILTRTFLAQRRRHRVRETPLDDATQIPAQPHDTATSVTLTRALASLPPRDRAVLVLRYYYDLTVAETAAHMRCSEAACRTRTSRALKRLRGQMPDLAPDATLGSSTDGTPR